ncbi:MAG: hypothetical protein H5U18_06670 [Rhodobacteraceae bacterium]|nr:hypothetical protein [Paracoccaceae bacterium]
MGKPEDIVRKHLGVDVVKRVEVLRDVNSDGEEILRIRVVYDQSKGSPSATDMSEITDEIWETSLASGQHAFPITNFISLDDDVSETIAAE